MSRRVETEFDLSTQQGIFDHVATRLLAQGKPAADGYSCRYRLGDCACAAGHLMPDDQMLRVSLGPISGEAKHYLDDRIPSDSATLTLLCNLQMAHDAPTGDGVSDTVWIREWKRQMIAVAAVYHLDPLLVQA